MGGFTHYICYRDYVADYLM